MVRPALDARREDWWRRGRPARHGGALTGGVEAGDFDRVGRVLAVKPAATLASCSAVAASPAACSTRTLAKVVPAVVSLPQRPPTPDRRPAGMLGVSCRQIRQRGGDPLRCRDQSTRVSRNHRSRDSSVGHGRRKGPFRWGNLRSRRDRAWRSPSARAVPPALKIRHVGTGHDSLS